MFINFKIVYNDYFQVMYQPNSQKNVLKYGHYIRKIFCFFNIKIISEVFYVMTAN